MLAYYYLWNLVVRRVIIVTNMKFNKAEAPTVGRRPTNNTGLLLELNSEAYIE